MENINDVNEKMVIERLQELNSGMLQGLKLFYSFTDEALDETKALQAVYSKCLDNEYILEEYKKRLNAE